MDHPKSPLVIEDSESSSSDEEGALQGDAQYSTDVVANGNGKVNAHGNYYSVAYHKNVTNTTRASIKDWNAEFQEIMDGMANSVEDTSLFDKLSALASDFTFVAKTYGKIIILERYLPEVAKTIKPIQIGGLAGGEKYITQGILFKFAMDIHGIYGGDEYSMKAASHDLKGLMGYYKCQIPGLHFPLMTLIDFRGYRLVAMSLLPLRQLLYGSNDGGVTAYNNDRDLNDLMSFAASKLNLKGHYVSSAHVLLHAPADIEGHKGLDGRFYLLDFARTFPPEAPSSAPHNSVMYYRLRSEFVRKYATPLSPDAFSAFGKDEADVHDKEVKQATKYLKKTIIPEFSKWLEDQTKERNWLSIRSHVSSWLHREGINVRHLGLVRSCYFSVDENDNSSQSVCSSSSSMSTASNNTRSSANTNTSATVPPSPVPILPAIPPLKPTPNTNTEVPNHSFIPKPANSSPRGKSVSRLADLAPSSLTITKAAEQPTTRIPPSPTKRTLSEHNSSNKNDTPAPISPSKPTVPVSPQKRNMLNTKNSRIPVLKRANLGDKLDAAANSGASSPPTQSALQPPPTSPRQTNVQPPLPQPTQTPTVQPQSSKIQPPPTNTLQPSAQPINAPTWANSDTIADDDSDAVMAAVDSDIPPRSTTPPSRSDLVTNKDATANLNMHQLDITNAKLPATTEMETDDVAAVNSKRDPSLPRIHSSSGSIGRSTGTHVHGLERAYSFPFLDSSDSMSINSSPRSSGNFDLMNASGDTRSPSRGSSRREGSIKSSTSSLTQFKAMSSQAAASQLLLHEMIARVVKTTLREKLRFRMQCVSTPSEKPFKREILEYFNLVLGRKPESEFYWLNDIKHEILRKFHKSLTQQEREADYPLNRGIDMYYVLERVMKMTGVRIQQAVMDQLRSNPDSFQFVYPDIEKMSATVKDMNIVAHAEGTSLYPSVKQKGHEGDRLFMLAMERYEAALSSTPDNFMMLKNWGDALYQQGLRKIGEDRSKLFIECAEKFRASKNFDSLLALAKNLHSQAKKEAGRDREQLFSLACENFKSTLEIYRNNKSLSDLIPNLFMLWGDTLWDQAITRVGVDKTESFAVADMEACELLYVTQGTKASSFMVQKYPVLSTMSPADVACLMRLSSFDETLTSVDASLCNKQISDDIICFLATHQPLLHSLKLSGCKGISSAAFRVSVPALTYLDVRDCQHLNIPDSQDFVSLLATNFPSVQSLLLGNNPLFTLPPPSSPALIFPKLHTLDLQLCRSLQPETAVNLCSRCPGLTNLNMAGCIQLVDSDIARILKTATKIKEVNFARCKITDAALVRVSALTGLRVGYCGGITKSSLGPLINRSPGLSHVKLPGCLVTDSILVSIARNCPYLTTLDVSHCSVTDSSLFEVAERSKNLTYLGLNKCQQITNEAIIRVTQNCTKLEVLKLGGLYKMGPEGLASAAHHCPSLVALDINGCERIESSTIVLLAHNCPKLTSINLGDCRLITDMAVVKLSQRCTSLTSVNLFNCRNIHNESLLSLAQNCPNLADLELAFTAITASAVDSLAKLSRSSLRVLGLSQCKIITDMALISLANHCPMLEDLDLSSCHKIGDLAIMNIAKYLGGSLRALSLGGCYKLTDTSIMRIAQDSPNLLVLKVGNCYKLTDASIIKIAQHCPNITTLLVNGCKQLTDASIIALANNAHNLQKISVESCPLISRPALLELRQKCPMLQYRVSS